MIRNDLRIYTSYTNQIPVTKNIDIERLEFGMINLIIYYCDIIKENPNLRYLFNNFLATNKLDVVDEKMLYDYRKNGISDDVASLMVIFYSVMRKISPYYSFGFGNA